MTCSAALKGTYCQEFNLQDIPLMSLNQTIKNCMENVYIYVIPNNMTDETNMAHLNLKANFLNGNLSNHYASLFVRGQGM